MSPVMGSLGCLKRDSGKFGSVIGLDRFAWGNQMERRSNRAAVGQRRRSRMKVSDLVWDRMVDCARSWPLTSCHEVWAAGRGVRGAVRWTSTCFSVISCVIFCLLLLLLRCLMLALRRVCVKLISCICIWGYRNTGDSEPLVDGMG